MLLKLVFGITSNNLFGHTLWMAILMLAYTTVVLWPHLTPQTLSCLFLKHQDTSSGIVGLVKGVGRWVHLGGKLVRNSLKKITSDLYTYTLNNGNGAVWVDWILIWLWTLVTCHASWEKKKVSEFSILSCSLPC